MSDPNVPVVPPSPEPQPISPQPAPPATGAPVPPAPASSGAAGHPGAPAYPGATADPTAPAYPAAPADPSALAYPAAPVAGQPKKLNVLALIAMIVSLVGFLFACIPGALIVGWILLPIGFVLSLVSLFLKGDKKWFGIVGLVAAIVGTVVGFIVFFAVVATAFDDAFSDDTVVSQPEDAAEEVPADEPAGEAESAGDEAQGTRENPYPLGSTISSSDWTVVVNSHTADGDATVAAANQFNDAPEAGSHYEIVNYTVTYTGDESGLSAEVGVAAVTGSGNVIESYDALVVLEDDFGLDELYTGASATGSAAFLVPDGETISIRVRPGIFADEVFVQP